MSTPMQAIENAEFIDPTAVRIARSAHKLFPGATKDLASGRQLGHPVHPVLTDTPIGFWASSLVLDLIGGEKSRGAADKLLLGGIVSALPTAWTGISDWSDTRGREMRVGAVHAAGNIAGLALYAASYIARKKGRRGTGVGLALLGGGAISGSGFLGGHLAYRLGVGVDQTVFDHGTPQDWTSVLLAQSLLEETPTPAEAAGIQILLYRTGGRILAIADRCSHRGGSLHEGKIDQFNCTVTCPLHASTFSLRTGELLGGPAVAPQPRFETRVENGQIQVRAARGAA